MKDRMRYGVLFTLVALFLLSCRESAETAVPKLVSQLENSKSRNSAIQTLASYGDDAREAVPALIPFLEDPNPGIQSSAAYALRRIGGADAEAALNHAEKKRARELGR